MKLYRKLIRPMHCYPAQDYSPRTMPIEKEVKWYPEEEREYLEKKYASYNEGSFNNLVFEEKYEQCDALALLKEQEAKIEQLNRFVNGFSRDAMPVVRCKYCKHKVDTVDDYNYESKCPCYCSGDEYYSWVPDDDWFCANGERKPD